MPREVEAGGPFATWADAVLPSESGDEVAAGIPDRTHAELFHQRFYVRTESVLVGARAAGFVNSVIYGSSEVLDERAEHAAVHYRCGSGWDPITAARMRSTGIFARRRELSRPLVS